MITRKLSITLASATILLTGLFSLSNSSVASEHGQFTRCTYKHNGDVYAIKVVFTRSCPEVDPPAESNGDEHKIIGDMPPSHPSYDPKPNIWQKIDDHSCEITIGSNSEA